jgi:hypothetical protein
VSLPHELLSLGFWAFVAPSDIATKLQVVICVQMVCSIDHLGPDRRFRGVVEAAGMFAFD